MGTFFRGIHNDNLVCIPCRRHTRGSSGVCPKCGKKMFFLGDKILIPPSTDIKGWKRLMSVVEKYQAGLVAYNHTRNISRFNRGKP